MTLHLCFNSAAEPLAKASRVLPGRVLHGRALHWCSGQEWVHGCCCFMCSYHAASVRMSPGLWGCRMEGKPCMQTLLTSSAGVYTRTRPGHPSEPTPSRALRLPTASDPVGSPSHPGHSGGEPGRKQIASSTLPTGPGIPAGSGPPSLNQGVSGKLPTMPPCVPL